MTPPQPQSMLTTLAAAAPTVIAADVDHPCRCPSCSRREPALPQSTWTTHAAAAPAIAIADVDHPSCRRRRANTPTIMDPPVPTSVDVAPMQVPPTDTPVKCTSIPRTSKTISFHQSLEGE
ncbi:uncharacterized protein LOC143039869 [Oratosquilla oratoria]|uniref:uncharacterized protein LOC143039869 n=1 Tax=Oratosquilla oratoria TaxID=337810 RepID=UPI003F7754C0